MTTFDSDRRKILKAGGAALTVGLAGCSMLQDGTGVPGTVEPRERRGPDVDDEWLGDAPNFDGEVVDLTGEEEVTVLNGEVEGYGGSFVFDPIDVQIDTGTTVTWEWVGGESHSVTHDGEEFDSETMAGDGTTWSYTFDQAGIYNYYCIPHRALGQKGRVRVGEAGQIASYLEDAPNWDGTIEDWTGQDDVTIVNGEPEGFDNFVYDPPAVTIDAGTTVTWEWAGDESHSVTHEEEAFDSETMAGDGTTWSYTFEESGLYLYYCIPHRALGQKGAILVE